jgi:glycosyltransferase involved in cell wall biosynthesis
MKLSIITINRNNAEGLRKTMVSVLSQTYRDFEYIIIDGASSDHSVDVIKELESEEVRELVGFNWISEPDLGVYNAMNKGIKKAMGEYLLFLNSGDFLIAPDVIERVMAHCNGADILCARCNVSDNGKVLWKSNPPEKVTFGTLYTVGLAHQSTFIKRMLFETCGLYREDFRYNSDIAFWYKAIIDNGATTQRIDVITTDYNLDGISSKEHENPQFKKEKLEILAPYKKFISDYEELMNLRENIVMWNWVKQHKLLYLAIRCLYRMGGNSR